MYLCSNQVLSERWFCFIPQPPHFRLISVQAIHLFLVFLGFRPEVHDFVQICTNDSVEGVSHEPKLKVLRVFKDLSYFF